MTHKKGSKHAGVLAL